MDIEQIISNKTITDQQKKDFLLEMDATLYTNLGSDSTQTERKNVKRQSKAIYKAIIKLDSSEKFLLSAIDEL